MRTTRRKAAVCVALMAMLVAMFVPATATANDDGSDGSHTVSWTGQGLDSIDEECPEGVDPYLHWVLTPGGQSDFTEATLHVNGDHVATFERKGQGQGAMHAYTGIVDLDATIEARTDGDAANANLVISDGCLGEAPPEVLGEVTVVKAWTGIDDPFDETDFSADLRVRIDGDNDNIHTVASGHTFTDLPLGTIVEIVGEDVTLPDECTYEHDGYSGKAWTVTEEAPVGTITLTNDITCDFDVVIDEPAVTVEFEKVWTGATDYDASAVNAWVTLDGEAFEFGDIIDITDWQGETLAVGELVSGLVAASDEGVVCTYEATFDDELVVPVLEDDDVHLERDITNEVTCVSPEAIVVTPDVEVRDRVVERVERVQRVDRPDVAVLGVAQERLPRTGASLIGLLAAGLLSLLFGGLMARRRRS